MSITITNNLLAIRTDQSVQFIDPKTSSVLQVITTSAEHLTIGDGYLLAVSSKNVCTAFDLKGAELWRQHLGGDAPIVGLFTEHGLTIVVYRNKEYKIFSQVFEIKCTLDVGGNEIGDVHLQDDMLVVVDPLQNYIYVFLLDDMLASVSKPYRVLKGNSSLIKGIAVQHYTVYSISDKQLIVFDISSGQISQQVALDSEPNCVVVDFDYAYVGCHNKNIYQIKVNNASNNYTMLPIQQEMKRKIHIGHLSAVVSLAWLHEEGRSILVSTGADGQVFFWDEHHLTKKMLSLNAKEVSVFARPQEYRLQTEEDVFFKSKRQVALKPIKKSKYPTSQVLLCKKRVNKIRIQFEVHRQVAQVDDAQVSELLEENQKLKRIIHHLMTV